MAEDDRTFRTSTPAANRAEMQGLGVGQKELHAARAGGERSRSSSGKGAGTASRSSGADGKAGEGRSFDNRNAAGMDADAEPGVDTPALDDEDLGDVTDEGMMRAQDHARREAERSQGRKTRQATKNIISRRPT